jgi:hypothetical protein
VADKNIDACVSWAPDIYNIPDKVPGTKLLSTTADAAKVLADVWAARADFARDHPEVIKGLVSGIFDGMVQLGKDPAFKEQACKWLGAGYSIPADEIKKMLNDAHSTNFAENKQFFLNASNPTNFERTWNRINLVYKDLGKMDAAVAFDQVMDFSVIKQLEGEGRFSGQTDSYTAQFAPADWQRTAEAPLLKHVIRIHFFPNSANLWQPAQDEVGNAIKGKLYDPSVGKTLDRVATLAGQFDRAIIMVTGHTDDSMRGRVPVDAVQQLSKERAQAVVAALIKRYKFPASKFHAEGKAWDLPVDANDPHNHAQNRRVEIAVFPLEGK